MVKQTSKTLVADTVSGNPKKPGPVPERVKIEGDWADALKTALAKKRPAGGWPGSEPKKKPKG